jgi:hypothetical protein
MDLDPITPLAPFSALARSRCPAHDAMLVALERELHAVDPRRVADALDDLARPLFGLAGALPGERVLALGGAAWAALPGEGETPADWLPGSALERGSATGAIRAALAVELARRAGISARPARARGCWLVCVADDGEHVAADVGSASQLEPWEADASLCAHQLAFVVLTGLASAWRRAGEGEHARRASALRLLLPLDAGLRALIERELGGGG